MLTTARCCQGVNPDQVRKNPKQNLEIFQVQVVAGKHNIFLEEEGQQVGNVEVIKLFVAMVQKIKFLKTITRGSQTNVQCAGVKFLVQFGSLSETQFFTRYPAKAITIHPDWNESSMEDDICLIELESPFEINSFVGSARCCFT